LPLSTSDRARVAEIGRSLAFYSDDCAPVEGMHEQRRPSGLAPIMEPLRELLRFGMSYAYSVEEHGDAYRLTLSETSGGCGPSLARDVMSDVVSRQPARFAGFDPRRPEPWNQNTVLVFDDLVRRGIQKAPVSEIALPRLNLRAQDQMRVLVCEGPSLLAWVGGFRQQPYTQRDRRVLGALVPALRRRLGLERTLASAGLMRAALEAAMEALAAPAFLLSTTGTPVLANTAGQTALDGEPAALRTRLSDAVRLPFCEEFNVTPVVSRGSPRRFLAIGRAGARVQRQVLTAASRWRLSRRQAEVLAWVLEGASNARIGAELRISDKTVETHMTAILERAQVGSRSELIVAAMRA